jgi:hypothetical protein
VLGFKEPSVRIVHGSTSVGQVVKGPQRHLFS